MTTVLVPFRSAGKSRLAGHLDVPDRTALARAMLVDVVDAVRGAGIGDVVVVAADEDAAATADRAGAVVLREPAGLGGLNGALTWAAGRLDDPDDVLVVVADLPSLTSADVEALLLADAPVVIAPTADGGTGALRRRPVTAIAAAYGPGSAARHAAAARDANVDLAIVERRGFALDLDTVEDLGALGDLYVGAATRAQLARIVSAR